MLFWPDSVAKLFWALKPVSSQGCASTHSNRDSIPSTGLGRETSVFIRLLLKYVLPLLAPFYPKRAARVVTKILINESCQTGLYYDDGRRPMLGSALVCDPKFTDRVVAGK
jgi:hypothetical protein